MMPGGAQRVIAQMCDHFVAHGHDTTLVTLEPESAGSFFPVSDGVRLMPLGRVSKPTWLGRVWRTAKWVRTIRRAIVSVRPDVVISFIDLTNVTVLMATRGLGVPVIVSERIRSASSRNWPPCQRAALHHLPDCCQDRGAD